MEASKVAADVALPLTRAGTAAPAEPGPPPANNQAAGNQAAGSQAAGNQAAADAMPLADQATIRPLDLAGALQILLAEVRAELDLALADALIQTPSPSTAQRSLTPGAAAPTPMQTARELAQSFLQALPEDASDAPAWIAALARADAAMLSSMARALDIVTQWRDVPAMAVEAVKDTRTLLVSALDDDPPSPLWAQPDWLGLGPLHRRYLRRRRNARRRLTDPDYSPQSLDETEEFYR